MLLFFEIFKLKIPPKVTLLNESKEFLILTINCNPSELCKKINVEFNAISSVKSALEKDEEMDFNLMAVTDSELKTIAESVKTLRTSMVD